MKILTFAEIGLLVPGQEVAYDSPFGSTRGYVSAVVPDDHVAIYNGAGDWTFTAEHFGAGILRLIEGKES